MRRLIETSKQALNSAFKKTVVGLIVASIFAPPLAYAQVPSFASPPQQPSTFMVGFSLTPAAVTAGDSVCIVGSASRTVKIKSIRVNGLDATAQTVPVNLIKRSAASTGGTSTQPTPVPVDTGQAITTATAVVNAYTGVPTPGAAVGTLSTQSLALAVTGTNTDDIFWVFAPPNLYSDIRLHGVAQQICVNFSVAFTAAPTFLAYEIIWTEQ
jgi:hypothetical protein